MDALMNAWFLLFQLAVAMVAGMLVYGSEPVLVMFVASLLIVPALLCIPTLRKAGFSAWWALPALIPGMILPMVWIFAFIRWPGDPD